MGAAPPHPCFIFMYELLNHLYATLLDSNMVETPKQQIEKVRPVNHHHHHPVKELESRLECRKPCVKSVQPNKRVVCA